MNNMIFSVNAELNQLYDNDGQLFLSIHFRDDYIEDRDKLIEMVNKIITPEKINEAIDFAIEEAGRFDPKEHLFAIETTRDICDINDVDHDKECILSSYMEIYNVDLDSKEIKNRIGQPFVTFIAKDK